jgi:hypothetical protein
MMVFFFHYGNSEVTHRNSMVFFELTVMLTIHEMLHLVDLLTVEKLSKE